MQSHKNEVTTGLLVVATLGLLVVALVVVGMPGVLRPMNTYRIYYDNANGIRPGAPVLLAGREIGKVSALSSPVPMEKRPTGHADYEVAIDVRVTGEAQIFREVKVRLTQQGLMGQQVIDFVKGDESSGRVDDGWEFIGERVPDLSESVANNLERLTGPESDLARTIKETRTLMETLNSSQIKGVISNTEQMTDTLKREPWRLIWPSTKTYGDEAKEPAKPAKGSKPGTEKKTNSGFRHR